MNERQQFEYEDYKEEHLENANGFFSLNKLKSQKYVLLVVVVVLIILTGTTVFFLKRNAVNKKLTQARQVEITRSMEIESRTCDQAQNQEKCLANIPLSLARETGDISYCNEIIDQKDYDDCVLLTALDSNNLAICDMVKNETRKTSCSDAILGSTPLSERTFEICEGFSDMKLREKCKSSLIRSYVLSGNCDYLEITDELCGIGEIISQAISLQDPDICKSIQDEEYASTCFEMTLPGDRDFDGLNADEEAYYGTDDRNSDSDGDGLLDWDEVNVHKTDPANSDTDKDGYSDGDEVFSGYSPVE